MFDARVEFQTGMRDAVRKLQAELLDAQNMGGAAGKQLVEAVGRADADQNKATFASQSGPGGGAWPALNPEYARRKRKAVGGKKMLVWNGSMRASATTAGSARRIARLAGRVIELGTNHPLAKRHQFGQRGTEYVRPHHRKLGTSGNGFRILPKSGKGRAQVRGFSRRVNLPARPFIGKSAEQEQAIRTTMTRVLTERLVRASGGRLNALRLQAARAGKRLIVVER